MRQHDQPCQEVDVLVFGAHFVLLAATDGIADHHLDCCRLVADGREQREANHLRLHAALAGRVLVVRLDMTDSNGRASDVCAICRRRVPCTWNRALRSQLRRARRGQHSLSVRARRQAQHAGGRRPDVRACCSGSNSETPSSCIVEASLAHNLCRPRAGTTSRAARRCKLLRPARLSRRFSRRQPLCCLLAPP